MNVTKVLQKGEILRLVKRENTRFFNTSSVNCFSNEQPNGLWHLLSEQANERANE